MEKFQIAVDRYFYIFNFVYRPYYFFFVYNPAPTSLKIKNNGESDARIIKYRKIFDEQSNLFKYINRVKIMFNLIENKPEKII